MIGRLLVALISPSAESSECHRQVAVALAAASLIVNRANANMLRAFRCRIKLAVGEIETVQTHRLVQVAKLSGHTITQAEVLL